jgi:hypothetical protein
MPWTKRLTEDPGTLDCLLRPETDLEQTLLAHPEVRTGLLWGEPRFGHPEGKVGIHVREVLDNIEHLPYLVAADRRRLRLVALIHDAFKYQEDRSRPRDWSKHHAMLARRFMEAYTNDSVVLDIIELHDEAYYAWLAMKSEGFREENPHKSLAYLLERVKGFLNLYYIFFKCDTQTGDKTQASVKWFEKTIHNLPVVEITPHTPASLRPVPASCASAHE